MFKSIGNSEKKVSRILRLGGFAEAKRIQACLLASAKRAGGQGFDLLISISRTKTESLFL
jgi:hypothetical protein